MTTLRYDGLGWYKFPLWANYICFMTVLNHLNIGDYIAIRDIKINFPVPPIPESPK